MKIKMNTLACGPNGRRQGICDVPDKEAQGYIDAGVAVPWPPAEEETIVVGPETEFGDDDPNTATTSPQEAAAMTSAKAPVPKGKRRK